MALTDDAIGVKRKREKRLRLSDEDFLRIVRAERENAVGIEAGDGILEEREKALEYFKGKMDDVPSLPNRSKVVSSDVADAVYTILPDLVEIFTGGEDLGSFRPRGEEDVAAARQETEAVNFVIMEQNDGFTLVHDTIMDALLTKIGVAYAWAEEQEETEEEDLERLTQAELMALQSQGFEVDEVEAVGLDDLTGEPVFRACVSRSYTEKCIKTGTVPSEDFAVARDTKRISETTYAVMRSRVRAQALKARGFDPDTVDELPAYVWATGEEVETARDQAGEHSSATNASEALHDLRSVLIYTHIIRVDADGDGKPEIWKVITDANEGYVLEKEKLNAVSFAVGTPYRMPHRLYGRSLADLLLEVQKIKTALQRAALDSATFALNQRHEVAQDGQTDDTINDLLNNLPGAPVRVRRSGTVTPIQSGSMGYDPFEALEYFSTVSEQRTGITRNAQGLNPDTLHDTAKGAMALMTMAQRRTRMVARVLAETLFKDLFLIVHGLLRQHGSRTLSVRLGNGWTQVDPTTWGVRKDMSIEIGMGSREQELMLLEAVKQDMAEIIQAQGGTMSGPVVQAKNVYSLALKRAQTARLKGASEFYTDPETVPPQEPQPDPAVVVKQMELEDKAKEREAGKEQVVLQHNKDVQLARIQQQDDMVRAKIEDADKAMAHELALIKANEDAAAAKRAHELALEKELNARIKLENDHAIANRQLDQKDRELDLKNEELSRKEQVEREKMNCDSWFKTVEMSDRRQEREAKAKEPKAEPKEDKHDKSGEALGAGLQAVGEGLKALAKPKRVKRGKDGKVEGIE